MEIFADGKVITLNDYKSATVTGSKQKTWKSITQEKGQREELSALAESLHHGNSWPISLKEQIQATRIAFQVEEQITMLEQPRGNFDVQ